MPEDQDDSHFTCLGCGWTNCTGNCLRRHRTQYTCHNNLCRFHPPQPQASGDEPCQEMPERERIVGPDDFLPQEITVEEFLAQNELLNQAESNRHAEGRVQQEQQPRQQEQPSQEGIRDNGQNPTARRTRRFDLTISEELYLEIFQRIFPATI